MERIRALLQAVKGLSEHHGKGEEVMQIAHQSRAWESWDRTPIKSPENENPDIGEMRRIHQVWHKKCPSGGFLPWWRTEVCGRADFMWWQTELGSCDSRAWRMKCYFQRAGRIVRWRIKPFWEGLQYCFSALWLRSSIVSALISLMFDMFSTWELNVKRIFEPRGSFWGLLHLFHLLT